MAEKLTIYLWIGAGSAAGGMARYWMSNWIAHRTGSSFPWGTLAVNVLGSLLIGALAALTLPGARPDWAPRLTPLAMIGFCGGFTTFSAFSLQTLQLIQAEHYAGAALNVALSVVACMAAVAIGFALVWNSHASHGPA